MSLRPALRSLVVGAGLLIPALGCSSIARHSYFAATDTPEPAEHRSFAWVGVPWGASGDCSLVQAGELELHVAVMNLRSRAFLWGPLYLPILPVFPFTLFTDSWDTSLRDDDSHAPAHPYIDLAATHVIVAVSIVGGFSEADTLHVLPAGFRLELADGTASLPPVRCWSNRTGETVSRGPATLTLAKLTEARPEDEIRFAAADSPWGKKIPQRDEHCQGGALSERGYALYLAYAVVPAELGALSVLGGEIRRNGRAIEVPPVGFERAGGWCFEAYVGEN